MIPSPIDVSAGLLRVVPAPAPAPDSDSAFRSACRTMLLIRRTEERLLELFSAGRLAGTTHTGIGQEDIAAGVAGALDPARDVVFSSHRCHGHFLAFGGPLDGLLAEIMGREGGVCGGRGGSQHLCWRGFHSNGIQGGIVPVACGQALALKRRGGGGLAGVFLGDGTFGEGAVYESLNLAALWSLPVLFVVEDNGYAQTTPKRLAVAGSLAARFQAFGIPAEELRAGDVMRIRRAAGGHAAAVRDGSGPRALILATYRLAPHSKGDDLRDPEELRRAWDADPLADALLRLPAAEAAALDAGARRLVAEAEARAEASPEPLPPREVRSLPPAAPNRFRVPPLAGHPRTAERLNAALHAAFEQDPAVLLAGEDVLDPYGGAFKVARGLSTRFPDRVLTTPISEAGLVGLCAGAAMRGLRPVAEIMFGDFTTLIVDQLVNHAAKFRWMYADQVRVPLLVRTPMGGGRGYGPTHSQSLERLFLGVPGLRVAAVDGFHDPAEVLLEALSQDDPVLLVENKLGYARPLFDAPPGFRVLRSPRPLGPVTVAPESGDPEITLLAYGGMDHRIRRELERLREEEVPAEAVIPAQIAPLDGFWPELLASLRRTGRLVVVEEGTGPSGFGAEVLAALAEDPAAPRAAARRVAAPPQPVPAAPSLERAMLPGEAVIAAAVEALLLGDHR